jgi:prepilin-type N-terminal cleavage/methylation domain-containing protein
MTRGRQGFTLIELLIVVVIIGILASIAIPKFSGVRDKAFVASVKADLRNLPNLQDVYYNDNYTYTTQNSANGAGFTSYTHGSPQTFNLTPAANSPLIDAASATYAPSLDSDGTTELLDVYDVFGMTQETLPFVLGTAGTKVKQKIIDLKRLIQTQLGGISFQRTHVLCSRSFMDSFLNHSSIEKAWELYQQNSFAREDNSTLFAMATFCHRVS